MFLMDQWMMMEKIKKMLMKKHILNLTEKLCLVSLDLNKRRNDEFKKIMKYVYF